MVGYHDGVHKCERCNSVFKAVFYGDETEVEFCPRCGSCLNDIITEDEIEQVENGK